MVPSPTNFGFSAEVPTAGFRWWTQKELRVWSVLRPEPEFPPAPAAAFGRLLVEGGRPDGSDGGRVIRYPCDNPVLFRELADLDPTDFGALLAFANAHGRLGQFGPVTSFNASKRNA